MASKTYNVRGMTCASCAQSVEKVLSKQNGVSMANVSFPDESVSIEFDDNEQSFESLRKVTQEIGYDIAEPAPSMTEEDENAEKEMKAFKNRTLLSVVLGTVVMILAMFVGDALPFNREIQMLLTAIILGGPGRVFFVNGFKRMRHLQTNMDTLVALSTGVAFTFSTFNTLFPQVLQSQGLEAHVYFESAAIIVALILLGKYLEHRAKNRARSSLRSLMNTQPTMVTLNFYGTEKRVPISEVGPGDELIVKTGERIPVDGVIISGELLLDESMLTGESDVVSKDKKAKVFTGTMVENGSANIIAHAVGEETRLSRIIDQVRKAQNSKAPIQDLADRISAVFVPAVIGIALITFAVWMLVGGPQALPFAFNALVSVLIIACPCALGLATPTAIMVGMGRGAEEGLLIQNAEIVQRAAGLDTIIFDKTGTLTTGKPEVVSEKWKSESETEKSVLVAMEKKSTHPISKSLVDYFSDFSAKKVELTDFKEVRGRGVQADVDGKKYFAGSQKYFLENGPTSDSDEVFDVYFFTSETFLGGYILQDELAEHISEVIADLKSQGKHIHLLSGDRTEKVKSLADKLSIKDWKAAVSPEEKSDYVANLKSKGHVVGMVGDGINDAIALAEADVSIAMGKGTDTAMEVAQVTLTNGKLDGLPKVLHLAEETMKVIKQNLFWAFGYNIVAIPLAAGVFYSLSGWLLHPMFAGGAMAFSSVAVVLNSLRLKRA